MKKGFPGRPSRGTGTDHREQTAVAPGPLPDSDRLAGPIISTDDILQSAINQEVSDEEDCPESRRPDRSTQPVLRAKLPVIIIHLTRTARQLVGQRQTCSKFCRSAAV